MVDTFEHIVFLHKYKTEKKKCNSPAEFVNVSKGMFETFPCGFRNIRIKIMLSIVGTHKIQRKKHPNFHFAHSLLTLLLNVKSFLQQMITRSWQKS